MENTQNTFKVVPNGITIVLSSAEVAELLGKHVANKVGRTGTYGISVSLPSEIRITIGDPVAGDIKDISGRHREALERLA